MKIFFLPLVYVSFTTLTTMAQDIQEKISTGLLQNQWEAKWITYPFAEGTSYGVYHARKKFVINSIPESFIIHITADNRYRLFVNEQPVCFGPARGDIWHWRFETVDIRPYLKEGENLLAVLFYNFGDYRPLAQHSYKTAFIIQGNSEKEFIINTGLNNQWKTFKNPAYQPIKIDWRMVNGFFAAGPADSINTRLYPWDWEKPGYDDSNWLPAGNIGYNGSGIPHGYHRFSGNSAWKLIPSNIPFMIERQERMLEIERSDIDKSIKIIDGTGGITIPPQTNTSILIDQTYLTKGYPHFLFSGGKNASVRIKYAEALINENGQKGNRNVVENKNLFGYYDIIIADGGKERKFSPLWLRTFRYINLEINTDMEPLVIHDFYNIYTGYPFEKNAWIKTDDQSLENIFNIGWRTLEMCADEIYWDCPYYEQLQYAGDTRTQTFISQYVSGDDRLFKNAIELFDHSRLSDGITFSRYPSYIPQVTPAYSLIWINMIYDYLMLGKDPDFTGKFLNGIEAVVQFYQNYIDSTGMVKHVPYTNHIESKSAFPWTENLEYLAQHNLLLTYTLQNAAKVFEFNAQPEKAKEYITLAEQINKATKQLCFDSKKGLFADTPEKKIYTQHVNVLAILSGALGTNGQKELMIKILNDDSLLPSYLFFKFYVFQALKKSGLGDLYLDQIDHWKNLLNYGFTTWPEFQVESRSDCHAWSAHPTYDLLATVCGIESDAPGFEKVHIEPHLGYLEFIEAEMPHPSGKIYINFQKTDEKGIKGRIILPDKVTGIFKWKNRSIVLIGGEQSFELPGH